jgi:hypothetical protein
MATNGTLGGLLASILDPEEAKKRAVWAKGHVIPGVDPDVFRRDDDGTVICFAEYGLYTEYGWQIDHQTATALGGLDVYGNLRPLHWRNNSSRGGLLSSILSGRRP